MFEVDFITVFDREDYCENIGLGYIKSMLEKHGIKTNIHVFHLDDSYNLDHLFYGRTPYLVGFSLYEHTQNYIYDMAANIKNKFANVPIVFGGPSTFNQAERLLEKYLFIDVVCNGEGEQTMLDYINCIKTGNDIASCRGITYRNEGEIKTNQPQDLKMQLDSLSNPARDCYEYEPKDYMFIVGSRGCTGHCTFCIDPARNTCIRSRSPKNVVDEIEYLMNTYNVNTFYAQESTFEDPGELGVERALDIYREIINRKLFIRFNINTRADTIVKYYNQKYINLAKNAGLESVFIGIESGNQEDLKLYGKKAKMQDNIDSIKLIYENDIAIRYGFISFNPYTNFDKLSKNAAFLNNSFLNFGIHNLKTIMKIYPQAAIAKKVKKDNLLLSDDFSYNSLGYNFKFQDPRVEKFYELLCTIDTPESCFLMDRQIDLDRVHNIRKQIHSTRLNTLYNSIKELRKDRNIYTYQFWNDCINLCQKDNYDKLTEQVKDNKFGWYNSQIEHLFYRWKKYSMSI